MIKNMYFYLREKMRKFLVLPSKDALLPDIAHDFCLLPVDQPIANSLEIAVLSSQECHSGRYSFSSYPSDPRILLFILPCNVPSINLRQA
jgi:hypothetical protein